MLTIRKDHEIHEEKGDWFHARWHFSFDHYRDPEQMGLGPLRVFNDDRLIPGAVWPLHPHRDVEGLTYVVEGTFRHEDNLGSDGVLPAGSVQRMTLGSGAWHSEQNASSEEPMRFIQLWVLPDTADLPPEVEQRVFTREDRADRLLKVMGPEGGEVVRVHQDAALYVSSLSQGAEVVHDIGRGRGAYLYLIEGEASLDEEEMRTGDAAKVLEEPSMRIRAKRQSELVLVDVPLHFQPVGIWARSPR